MKPNRQKRKNIIVGEESPELSKSRQEAPVKKVPKDSLKNSMLGGQDKNKGAMSAKTGLETGLTCHSWNSGKIP